MKPSIITTIWLTLEYTSNESHQILISFNLPRFKTNFYEGSSALLTMFILRKFPVEKKCWRNFLITLPENELAEISLTKTITQSTEQTTKIFHSADLHLKMCFPLQQHLYDWETDRQIFCNSLTKFACPVRNLQYDVISVVIWHFSDIDKKRDLGHI